MYVTYDLLILQFIDFLRLDSEIGMTIVPVDIQTVFVL